MRTFSGPVATPVRAATRAATARRSPSVPRIAAYPVCPPRAERCIAARMPGSVGTSCSPIVRSAIATPAALSARARKKRPQPPDPSPVRCEMRCDILMGRTGPRVRGEVKHRPLPLPSARKNPRGSARGQTAPSLLRWPSCGRAAITRRASAPAPPGPSSAARCARCGRRRAAARASPRPAPSPTAAEPSSCGNTAPVPPDPSR
jgi:hypothetical protein